MIGTAAELEVDGHVRGDRRRVGQGRDELRLRVDDREELLDVAEVAQGLDAAGRRARADRHEPLRRGSHLADARRVCRGRDRALDEREVVRSGGVRAAGLEEVRQLHLAGQREQLVFAVEQRELATVARRELPHRERRLPREARSLIGPEPRAAAGAGPRRAPDPHGIRRRRRADSVRNARWRTACCAPPTI